MRTDKDVSKRYDRRSRRGYDSSSPQRRRNRKKGGPGKGLALDLVSVNSEASEENFGKTFGKTIDNLYDSMAGSMSALMNNPNLTDYDLSANMNKFTTDMNCADVTQNLNKNLNTMNCNVPQPDFNFKLDWRQNANISLSDWTITVYDGKDSAVYNIHRSEVGSGPRQSGLLASKFSEDEQRATTDPTTEVYVPPRAAAMFPEFLDYIDHDQIEISTKDVIALKHLANHFDVRPLYKQCQEFMEDDLDIKTAPVYCYTADLVLDEDVKENAVRLMAQKFGRMNMKVVTKLPPQLFKEVLTSAHLDVESEFLSTKVAQFLRFSESEISDEVLFMLTHPQIMPTVSPDEAFFFLNQGLKYPQVLNEGGDMSLRNRCVEAVTGSWMTTLAGPIATLKPRQAGFGDEDPDVDPECAFNYSSLPAEIKVELFESAILVAKGDVEKSTTRRHF
jgi:hypothetical protein